MKKPWDRGVLRVADNHRYLMNGDTPFFWMGDTAWLLFCKLTMDETYEYLKNRKEKGFNIILVDFIHTVDQCNVNGSFALQKGDIAKPDLTKDYWDHIDKVIYMAQEMGLYMGILPVWGSSIVKNGFLTMDNVDAYINFICERYKASPNLVWILGGDVRGDVNESLVDYMGSRMKKLNPDKLISYHPFGRTSSSQWHHNKWWLDFNMFQSGHRRYDQACLGAWDDNAVKDEYYGEDSWRYVKNDYAKEPPKPTIDGEPSYEHILQGLHDETQPYWQAEDVRRYAYWSVFAGAFGHTYGDNSIMQFFKKEEKKGAFGVKDPWQIGLNHPGASQMTHLVNLMNSVNFVNGRACPELVHDQKEKYDYIAVFAGEDFIFCYDYNARPFSLTMTKYKNIPMEAFWYDTVTGDKKIMKEIVGQDQYEVIPPIREKCQDILLVIQKKR